MNSKVFPYVVSISALSIAIMAAFFSVFGISSLFSGAFVPAAIMAGSLEVGKLVATSFLYRYWNDISTFMKTYLLAGSLILMLITSGGIYGYLSAAYQDTATKSELMDKTVQTISVKRNRFDSMRMELSTEKNQLNETISSLRESLSNPTQIQYIDKDTGQLVTTTSANQRKVLQAELATVISSRDLVSEKMEALADSVAMLDIQILNSEIENEASRELGPLKYISTLAGVPMDRVVNWFLLLIIFVFDPMAVSLVLAANVAFMKASSDGQLSVEVIQESESSSMEMEEKCDRPIDVADKVESIRDGKVHILPADGISDRR